MCPSSIAGIVLNRSHAWYSAPSSPCAAGDFLSNCCGADAPPRSSRDVTNPVIEMVTV
jgi:hypothetical protein